MRYFFPVFNTVFAVASLCTRMYRMYTRERLQNVQHKVVQKKLIRCCILTKNLKGTSKNVIRSWIHFESLNKGKIGLLNLFSLTSTSSSSISCIHYKWPPSVSNSTYSSTNRRIWTKAKKNSRFGFVRTYEDSWSKMWIFFNICQTQWNPFYQFAPMAAPAPTSLYYIDVIYHKSGTHCTKILFLNHELLKTQFGPSSCIVWKSPKMSQFEVWHSHQFWAIKIDKSGNTNWPQASRFQNYSL